MQSSLTYKPYVHSYEKVTEIGTGIWWLFHSIAFDVDTYEKWDAFMNTVRILRTSFPGLDCRNAFDTFVKNHPLESRIREKYQGKPSGAFRWTVEAHNAVNERNGKRIMPFEEAWEIFDKYSKGFSSTCNVDDRDFEEPSNTFERPRIISNNRSPVRTPDSFNRDIRPVPIRELTPNAYRRDMQTGIQQIEYQQPMPLFDMTNSGPAYDLNNEGPRLVSEYPETSDSPERFGSVRQTYTPSSNDGNLLPPLPLEQPSSSIRQDMQKPLPGQRSNPLRRAGKRGRTSGTIRLQGE